MDGFHSYRPAEGHGLRATIALRVEMDSHEREQKKFNGDYYKRFR